MNKTDRLGSDRIGKLLLEYSIPATVGMLVTGTYNIVNRIFIGHSEGSLGIAALSVAFPIMTILMALSGMVGLGATASISIKLGQGDTRLAQRISGNAIILLGAITIFMTVFGIIFLEPLLRIFGASAEVMPYAKKYTTIILLGTIFSTFSYGLNSMMRAEGKPITAMVTMLIGTVINIILTPILIFALNWGMIGAAVSTVFSQAVSATWILTHFLRGDGLLRIRLKNMQPNFTVMKDILVIGMPVFLVQAAATVQLAVMNNNLLKYGGDVAISGMGIVTSIAMLVTMPIFGINQGSQPVIGYNYGAGKYERVRKAFRLAVTATVSVSTLGFLLTRLFPREIISMFNDDPALVEFGSHALTVYLMFFMTIGFQIAGANYFLAVGKPKYSMFLSLSRQGLILIPLLIILPHFLQMKGVLIAGPISDIIAFVITAIFLFFEMRRLNRLIKEKSLLASDGSAIRNPL